MKLSLFLKSGCVAIATLILLVAVATFVISSVYPRYGYIVAVEYDYDDYLIEDLAGLVWCVEGIEDLSLGDDVALLMWNHFTPNNIYDDWIIDMR